MHRRGSIFLFILGVMGVLFAVAFSLLASSQMASTSGFETDPDLLADQAAREGVDHAIAVIRADFLSGAGIPTTLRDDWRQHFWAIDTHEEGQDTSNVGDDAPRGREFNPQDSYENDVHVENLLTELYCKVDGSHGAYNGRNEIYPQGWLNHPGTGRWFEPGLRTADPVARPLSFHLDHPAPAQSGSLDPALRAGENWSPAVDETIRYDAHLRATTEPSQVRYRLRYAIAVEDLSGHLLSGVPGDYDPAATRAPGGVPDAADLAAAMEVDRQRAERYAPAFAEMVEHRGGYGEWAEVAFRGLGYQRDETSGEGLWRAWSLAAVESGGALSGHADYDRTGALPPGEPDHLIDQREVVTGSDEIAHQLLGPVPSFGAFSLGGNNEQLRRAYLYTPFGRAPSTTAGPTAWDVARVDTPWRVNVPTATQQALVAMLYAYLPQEFKAGIFTQRVTWDFNGFKLDPKELKIDPDWINKQTQSIDPSNPDALGLVPTRDLFLQMSGLAAFAQRGDVGAAGEPYPGTAPKSPGSHWTADLGAACTVNERMDQGRSSALGSNSGYDVGIFGDITEKQEQFPGGEKVVRTGPGSGKPFSRRGGFYYGDSYWLDLATAFVHTMALAQYAWADRVNGRWDGDAQSGIPHWPSLPAGYFPAVDAPAFAPGKRCLDLDLDGDGDPDVVSALDSVAELDHQFLRNLGEWPEPYPKDGRPTEANVALAVEGGWGLAEPEVEVHDLSVYLTVTRDQKDAAGETVKDAGGKAIKETVTLPASKPIKGMLLAGDIDADQAGLMELVVNDFRMSFFGASPQYTDFRPIDLDDDGTVRCSAYAAGAAPADSNTGYGPAVDRPFSLSGYLVFQKSRYYRIFVRGEVFDTVRGVPVAQSDREAVLAVDPDGDVWDLWNQPGSAGAAGMADTHVLFQRRLHNAYRGFRSHASR